MKVDYTEVFDKRHKHDCLVQPTFSNDFDEIKTDLRNHLSLEQPYVSEKPLGDFTKNQCYKQGEENWYAGVFESRTKYLYRIDNLFKLFSYNDIFPNQNIINKTYFRKNFLINRFIEDLLDRSQIPVLYDAITQSGTNWLSVSDFLLKYKNFRDITWWTDAIFPDSDSEEFLLESSQKLGLATNWISNYSVIMRYRLYDIANNTKLLSNIKVPSIIDAFHNSIFLAQNEKNNPKHGIAINLKDATATGHNEYTIRNISKELLEFKPLKVSDNCKTKYIDTSESFDLYEKILNNLFT